MKNEPLGFGCPRCGAALLVPVEAAGVEGPCPRCGTVIRAPMPAIPRVGEAPVRLEVAEAPRKTPRETLATTFQAASPAAMVSEVPAKGVPGWVKPVGWIAAAVALVAGSLVAMRGLSGAGDESRKEIPFAVPPKVAVPEAAPTASAPAKAGEGEISAALDPRVPPEGMNVGAMIARAAETLGRFLAAKSLDERLGLIETATPREELEDSVLARDFKISPSFASTEVRFNKVENSADAVFMVDFHTPDGLAEKHMLVVRTRGDQEPKVLADPFLDGYGGRLEAFAAGPHPGEGVFRTVMTAFDFCKEEKIPEHAQKFTAKFAYHPGGRDLGKAYFSGSSPLAKKLEKQGVVYGRSIGATVVLRWNEGPEPYLELLDVRSFGWVD